MGDGAAWARGGIIRQQMGINEGKYDRKQGEEVKHSEEGWRKRVDNELG